MAHQFMEGHASMQELAIKPICEFAYNCKIPENFLQEFQKVCTQSVEMMLEIDRTSKESKQTETNIEAIHARPSSPVLGFLNHQ